jgi:hypothetical protein
MLYHLQKRTSVLKALVGLALLSLLTFGAGVHAPTRVEAGHLHQDFPPKPGATAIIITLPNLNPTAAPAAKPPAPPPPRKVTSKRPDASIGIATRDSYVRGLLSRLPHRAGVSSPWRGVAGGRVTSFALTSARTVSGKWLALGRIPYSATYLRVKTIKAYVSMSRRTVEELQPGR